MDMPIAKFIAPSHLIPAPALAKHGHANSKVYRSED
eukprot:CAMPEP_0115834172 /NCGR_PEP_ID=MMETSP0287-20121206/3548_1 /TAXON_ID=412157 /ORGANISM="Chrysochromulina rotalis, Strain UIO044" /LENGTH=35 /DNA_ID= /DNA_START= /DNA_END= /DNA_ORIENTATION=